MAKKKKLTVDPPGVTARAARVIQAARPRQITYVPICHTENEKALGAPTTSEEEAQQIAKEHGDSTGHDVDVKINE